MEREMENIFHYHNNRDVNKELDFEQSKNEIEKFIKHNLNSDNLAVFLGSGCSVGAIPLMRETMKNILTSNEIALKTVKKMLGNKCIQTFIDFITKHEENEKLIVLILEIMKENNIKTISDLNIILDDDIIGYAELSEKLKEFYLSFNDIEEFLNWIQNGINYNPKESSLSECLQIVKENFIKTIPDTESNIYSEGKVIENYREFYREIFNNRNESSSKLSIFTTNYDLFNEFGLESNGIVYSTGFNSNIKRRFDINQFKFRFVDDTNRYKDKWQPVTKEANLYKLHGSINWISDDKGFMFQEQTYEKYSEEKVIIYPTILKHKETAQSPYSELFREFANVLQRKNTTLFIIGYGFSDDHINNIISQNLKNPDFNLIIFGSLLEENIKMFTEINKMSKGLHVIGGRDSFGNQIHYFNYIIDNFLKTGKNLDGNGSSINA